MMILSKRLIGLQGNLARAARRLHEKPFVKPLSAIRRNNLNTIIAEGMNAIRLPPMNFRFGKASSHGVMNEAR